MKAHYGLQPISQEWDQFNDSRPVLKEKEIEWNVIYQSPVHEIIQLDKWKYV